MTTARTYAAFLFDMDGTVLDSIAVAERVWGDWARRHGLDVAAFLPTIHGVRAVETIRRQGLKGVDAEHEALLLLRAESADLDGIRPIAGARAFLDSLPPERWAVVTSAPRELALQRIAAVGLPIPAVLVAAEDVTRGKPEPDGFQLAARRLGVDVRACLVFEDAPAGVLAAEAAGAEVVVITATHQHPVDTTHRTIASYEGLRAVVDPDGLRLVAA